MTIDLIYRMSSNLGYTGIYMKQKMSKNILWMDLEMTGLDPIEDRILEVGVVVTDWDFNEIATLIGRAHV